jgi:predicted phage terminase large subunit-like protein
MMPLLNDNLRRLLDLEAVRAEKARRKLSEFIRQAWPIIEPGTPYLDNWHIDCVAEHLQAVTLGQITRLLINVPPRHMKSISVTIMWPAWEWIDLAHLKWMFASYSGDLSRTHSVLRRDIILSDWYQRHFGDRYKLVGDQNVKTEYKNDKHGVMFATSFGGTTTGKGGERIVVDDPHNPTQAESEPVRKSQITFFDRSLYTRLNDKKKGVIAIVKQRLNEKDLSGHVLADSADDPYVHLCLPAEAEKRTVIKFPVSGREFIREKGDLLWPDREGPKELKAARLRLGIYGYAGQYQQSPAPSGGGKFKREWYCYYTLTEDLSVYKLIDANGAERHVNVDDCDRFAMIDPAGTDEKRDTDACYTVIQIWDITPSPADDMILVDQWREQKETPEVEKAAVAWGRRFQVNFIGVESAGLGLGVIQHIRKRFGAVRGIPTKGSKEARCEVAQVRMSNGRIFFPAKAPFLFDLKSELENFPRGEFKDQVDALSHAAIYVQNVRGAVRSTADDEADEYSDKRHAEESKDETGSARREIADLMDAGDFEDFD